MIKTYIQEKLDNKEPGALEMDAFHDKRNTYNCSIEYDITNTFILGFVLDWVMRLRAQAPIIHIRDDA